MRREAGIALAETGLAAALWGTSFPVVSLGVKGRLDPRTFVFLRFATTASVMLGATWALGRDMMPLPRNRALWVVGLFDAVRFFCKFIGQQYTGASVAALLISMSIVLAAIGAVVFLGERPGGLQGGWHLPRGRRDVLNNDKRGFWGGGQRPGARRRVVPHRCRVLGRLHTLLQEEDGRTEGGTLWPRPRASLQ